MKCTNGYEIKVMRSAAGYYVGTSDENGFPMCHISGYYKTREPAEEALNNKTFFRVAEEISFCNKGYGCIPEEEDIDIDDLLEDWENSWSDMYESCL